MEWKWLWVVFVAFLLGGFCECQGCFEQEKIALLQLKLFFNHIQDVKNYWVEGNLSSNCCKWKRVECNTSTGRVTGLFLNLKDTITRGESTYSLYAGGYTEYGWQERDHWYLNTSLFLPFEELKSLYLGGNSISGCVDNQGFGRLSSKLEILDLSYNYLNDSILVSMSQLSSLKSLYLARNQLTGSNPTDGIHRLSKLNNLETLDLSVNLFNNSIFSSLAAFLNMKFLYMGRNRLKGSISIKDLNALSNLEELYMEYNEVNDFVPSQDNETELKLMNLEVLDLSWNLFNSTILSSLGRLSNLKTLSLGVNNLERSIDLKDVVLDAPSKLEALDMGCSSYYTDPKGTICSLPPQALDIFSSLKSLSLGGFSLNRTRTTLKKQNLTSLEELTLKYSSFPSNFIQDIGALTSLKKLYVYGCESNGNLNLHDQWKNSTSNLEELVLEDSSFPSNFIQDIGTMTSLKYLQVYYCDVNGSLTIHGPLDLKNLESLEISETSMENNFLKKIGAMHSLKFLRLSNCGIKGTLHSQGFCELNLSNLQNLDISENNLKGNLPECFSNLTSLERLDLSSNQLFGNVNVFGNLKSLKFLLLRDCGINNTTLHNTKGFCELTNLRYLNMGSNDLIGNLPNCFSNLTSLDTLDLSSNQFFGNISAFSLGNLKSLRDLSLSNNNFEIPISLGPLFNLSNLMFFDADNNTIYDVETEMHSLAPKFQLQSISLSCCGKVGSFPHFLYHQHDFEYVDLSNIHFKGDQQFPFWLLENNTNLHRLALANNSLMGHFELPFLSHAHLTSLDISGNSLCGNIPNEIGAKLPSLWFLNMSTNNFGGTVPVSIGDLNSLYTLDLSNNKLIGEVPEHLANGCFTLSNLILSNNSLQGHIFSSNFNLLKLRRLQLDGNHFFGRIPDCLSNCSFLSTLDVSNNNLSGEIPMWIGNMSNLEYIIMANNHLQGPIPSEFCQLNLKLLDLSSNNISGSLPSCLSPLSITQVHLSKNKLQGPLTNAFANSIMLVTLDLSHNSLTGNIPNWIGKLSQLSHLILNNNHFQGWIPLQLCRLGNLSLIDLANNNLSGKIPPCLKIMTLNHISQDYIRAKIPSPPSRSFSIDEPIEFTRKNRSDSYKGRVLTYLSGIDLSCNKLTGEIPQEVRNFQNINVLNFSHNSLTGPIPPAVSELRQIESLDLSHNNLSGKIPSQIVGLTFLSVFSVAYNNLSGSTPVRTAQFATFEENNYLGNPFLCGAPLPKGCSTSGPASSSSKTKASYENSLIDMNVFYASFGVAYVMVLLTIASVLYINPYWRRAWFYHIEAGITCCYYFLEDNILPKRFHCGCM